MQNFRWTYIYIYIHMFFVSDLQHTPTSEDSSVAAGVATVATWWEDCFGEYISDTGILWRPKNIRNHSWRYCTHHAHKTSLHSFPHCPFQKTAIKRLSSLCVRSFLWSRRGLMRASHSKCSIHQRDWFVLGLFRLYTPEEWKLCIVASQNKTMNFKCRTVDIYIYKYMNIYIYIHVFVSDLQHTPTSEDSSVAAGVATVATWWEDCFGEYINDTGILWRPKNIRNHSWRYCTHHAHKTSLPSLPNCPFKKKQQSKGCQASVSAVFSGASGAWWEPVILSVPSIRGIGLFWGCIKLHHSILSLLIKKTVNFKCRIIYIYIYKSKYMYMLFVTDLHHTHLRRFLCGCSCRHSSNLVGGLFWWIY